MEKYGIKISNYKCFDNPIGFNEIKPINVIIGKNNIGKSSLIDMIEFHYDMDKYYDECKKNSKLKLIINKTLDTNDLGLFYSHTSSSWNKSSNPKLDDYAYAIKNFINKEFCYNYRVSKEFSYGSKDSKKDFQHIPNKFFLDSNSSESIQIINSIRFEQKNVKRIYSERNIHSFLNLC